MSENRKLYRSETKRMLGGVCGGLSDYFGVDATIVRVLFLLLCFVGGAGILLYPALWIVVPTESRVDAPRPGSPGKAEGRSRAD
jgi:phage shock protein C